MVFSFWNMLDFFAFFPPLLELWVAHSISINFSMGHFDFRWFKILRWVAAAPRHASADPTRHHCHAL